MAITHDAHALNTDARSSVGKPTAHLPCHSTLSPCLMLLSSAATDSPKRTAVRRAGTWSTSAWSWGARSTTSNRQRHKTDAQAICVLVQLSA